MTRYAPAMAKNVRIAVSRTTRDGANRPVSGGKALDQELSKRAGDIEAAIREATAIASRSLVEPTGGFSVSSLEVTFGVSLSAEAGVIVSKASIEASLEVTVSIERKDG